MGNAQTRNVKERVKRTILRNRQVCGDASAGVRMDGDSHTAVIDAGLTDPEQFHCLAAPLKNKWRREFETLDMFCRQLKAHLIKRGVELLPCKRVYMNILQAIYNKFCQIIPDLVLNAKRRSTTDKDWRLKDRRHGIQSRAY